MANLFRKFLNIVTMLALVLVSKPAFAQTSITVEVRVLELSRAELETLGGTIGKPAFTKQISKSKADSLAAMPRSRIVHRIELPAVSGASTQMRLDTRITVTSSSSADVQTFFDAGIVMDVTPKVFQNRDISLATASQVRIRRGPDANGVSLVIFENPSTRFDTRMQEGESIVLGGFITPAERMTLPDMPMLPDSPILNYLYPKARELKDRPEIAILLTPQIAGMLIDAAVDAPVIASKPAAVTPPVASLTPPAPSPLAAAAPASVTAPPSAITSALPASNIPPAVNSSPIISSPPVVASTPVVLGTTEAAMKPLVINSPPVIASTSTTSSTAPAVSRPPVVTPPSEVPSTAASAVANLPETEGTGGKYTVQVGAFDQLDKAEALRSQLAKNYDMVFVEKVSTSKTPYRVRVGRFEDMQSARKIEKQLESDGFDTYVTTLN